MIPASVDATKISDRFDIAKDRVDSSWDHEDNSGIASLDAGTPSAVCIGHFCSVDSHTLRLDLASVKYIFIYPKD